MTAVKKHLTPTRYKAFRPSRLLKYNHTFALNFKYDYPYNNIFSKFKSCKLGKFRVSKSTLKSSRIDLIGSKTYSILYVIRLFMLSGLSSQTYKKVFSFLYGDFVKLSSSAFSLAKVLSSCKVLIADIRLGTISQLIHTLESAAIQNTSVEKPVLESSLSLLTLSYTIKYQALGKKMRKIIKNKYRFTKKYQYIYSWDRLRVGLRLLKLASRLYTSTRWFDNFKSVVSSYIFSRLNSPVYKLWYVNQVNALRALSLK